MSSDSERKSPALMRRSGRIFFLFAATFTSLVFSLCSYYSDVPIVPHGPGTAIAAVTKSIVDEGTLSPPYFRRVFQDCVAQSRANSEFVWQDVFAIDKRGNLVSKHSIFSAIAAVPFYAIFGYVGFWLMEQLFFLLLLYSTYLLVEEISGHALPWTTLVVTCFLSQALFYSYEFSADLHGATLIIAGLYLQRQYPAFGGALMALSVFVRPSNVLLAVPLALSAVFRGGRPLLVRSLAGTSLSLLLFAVMNYAFWGNPFITSYSRLPSFQSGEIQILPHAVGFDLTEFTSRWGEKIVGSKGLLPYNLCMIAFPIVGFSIWKRRDSFRLACFWIATLYTLYIFSYIAWMYTTFGNRFLLPSIFLYIICLIPELKRFEARGPRQPKRLRL